MRMEFASKGVRLLIIGIALGLILGSFVFFTVVYPQWEAVTTASVLELEEREKHTPTGNFLIEKGSTTKYGQKEKGNPHYGALKGTVTYTILDSDGTVIDRVNNTNRFLLFTAAGNSIQNFAFIATGDFNLSNVDADSVESRCDKVKYKTITYFYDANNNTLQDVGEFDVYETTPDDAGCFASKLPPGLYDLYLGNKLTEDRGKDKDWWEEVS